MLVVGGVVRNRKCGTASKQPHPNLTPAVERRHEGNGLTVRRHRWHFFDADKVGDPLEPHIGRGAGRRSRSARSTADCDASDGGEDNSKGGKAKPRPGGRSCRDSASGNLSGILRPPPRDAPQIDDQIAHRLVAVSRILFERLLHDHPQRHGNIRAERRRIAVNDALQHFELAHPRERTPPGEQLVKHDTKGKDVASRVERFARRLFRGHVRDRSDDDAVVGDRFRRRHGGLVRHSVGHLGETKIRELRVTVLGNEHVLRLDVAVEDAGLMRRRERVRDADQQIDDLTPGPRLLGGPFLQRAAVDEF